MKRTAWIVIAAVGWIIAAGIVARPWITLRHVRPITVKGYAEQEVTSDSASLTAVVMATGPTAAEAYQGAGRALTRCRDVIAEALGARATMVELGTTVEDVPKVNEQGKKMNEVDYYIAHRRLRVDSSDVQSMERLGRALNDLNAEGIRVNVVGPDFFISNAALEQVKLNLIKAATEDAHVRAQTMAQGSGARVGRLVSARQGVFQITKRNSSETSDYGIYDTETIQKIVRVTVTLEYEVAR
jgi:hypothetical protein